MRQRKEYEDTRTCRQCMSFRECVEKISEDNLQVCFSYREYKPVFNNERHRGNKKDGKRRREYSDNKRYPRR